MKDSIMQKCELLVENRGLVQKGFLMENGLIKTVTAAAYTERNKRVDAESLKEARAILRKKQGIFSDFRGNSELIVATKMALSGNPERYVDDVIEVYHKFQEGKFWNSVYRALAAMTIVDTGNANQAERIIDKTNEILRGMRDAHPFLTSDEDTCFTVLLAMNDRSVDDILNELEENFASLSAHITFAKNPVFSLAQVVTAYPGDAAAKSEKIKDIFDALKDGGHKYSKSYELASLGTLVDVPGEIGEIAADVIEACDSFKGQKGFGILDMSQQTKLMFAVMMVTSANNCDNTGADASVVGGTIARVIAEETAMYLTTMSAIAAASASSN